MRWAIPVASVVLCATVAVGSVALYGFAQIPSVEDKSASSEVTSEMVYLYYHEQGKYMTTYLNPATTALIVRDNTDIVLYLQKLEDEQVQKEAEEDAKRKFLEEQYRLEQERLALQEQLEQEALAAIEREGGIDVTTEDTIYLDTTAAPVVTPKPVTTPSTIMAGGSDNIPVTTVSPDEQWDQNLFASLSPAASRPPTADDPSVTTEFPSQDVIEESYLGQFTGEVQCACGQCTVGSPWTGILAGENCILVSAEYASKGTKAVLDIYPGIVFKIKAGDSTMKGREIKVYYSDSGVHLSKEEVYPKVTIVG